MAYIYSGAHLSRKCSNGNRNERAINLYNHYSHCYYLPSVAIIMNARFLMWIWFNLFLIKYQTNIASQVYVLLLLASVERYACIQIVAVLNVDMKLDGLLILWRVKIAFYTEFKVLQQNNKNEMKLTFIYWCLLIA